MTFAAPEHELIRAAAAGDLAAASRLLQDGASADAAVPVHVRRAEDSGDVPALDLAERTLDTALAAAAGSGSTEIVRLLLVHGAEVNRAGERGAPPLSNAVAHGDAAMVALLLRAGAVPNVRDGLGATPLYRAVIAGDAGLVSRLLAAGADPNLRSSGLVGAREGVPSSGVPLIEAARRGRIDLASLLLEAGARANARDGEGKPALFWAIVEGGDDAALLLLEHGANPTQHVDGYEVQHFARAMQRPRTAERIEAAR